MFFGCFETVGTAWNMKITFNIANSSIALVVYTRPFAHNRLPIAAVYFIRIICKTLRWENPMWKTPHRFQQPE